MKRSIAVMVDLQHDGTRTEQALVAEQIAAMRAMAHHLSTCNLPRKGEFTTAGGVRVRWSMKETETRQ